MSYTLQFDSAKKLVRVTAEGPESMLSAMESMLSLREHSEFARGYGILCDLRQQTFVPDAAQASGLGTLMAGLFYGHKLAFVINDPAHVVGQQMVIAAANSEVSASVFDDPNSAEAWLVDG